MKNQDIHIQGGKFFWLEDELMLSVGSRDFYQKDIENLSLIDDISGILFYYVRFKGVDFSILKSKKIKKITFLHGNFNDNNLKQLEDFSSLRLIKLHDTQVTIDAISEYSRKFPLVVFK